MDCQECQINSSLRHCRCGSEDSCCSSISCPRNDDEMNTSCVENDNYHTDDKSKHTQQPITSTAAAPPIETCQNYNHRRPTRLRCRPFFNLTQSSYAFHHHFLLVVLLFLNTLIPTQQQGITFGGILNLDRCYAAMQNSQTDDKISRSQYVSFVQELANNQFQSFGYDAATNTYGNVPTEDFNSLPEAVRQEFNSFACGGKNTFCDNAFLYTEGTAPDDPVPAPQQEVYLYQVCERVESAIEDTLPKTDKPTGSPTTGSPTSAPTPPEMVVEEKVSLNYHISVPSFITAGGFQNGDTDESEELKEALLTAVQTWSQNMASELSQEGGSVFARRNQRNKKKKHGRVLAVTIDADQIQFTNVTTAVCNTEPTQLRYICLDIEMEIPLQLSGNQSLTPGEIKSTIQSKFDESLKDGSFYNSLPPDVLEYISGISPQRIALSPPPTAQATVAAPSPPQQDAVNPQIPSVKAPEPTPPSPEGGGDSSIVGIAAGVSAGLVVIIAGFFVFRRRRAHKRKFDNTDSTPSFGRRESNESYTKSLFSAFVPKKKDIKSDDLEWGQDQASNDSGSMQSYSSHSSSGSDSSSYSSSSSSSSEGGGGPASISASSASSYDTHPDDLGRPIGQPKNDSMTSGKSSSSSEAGKDKAQLYDFNKSDESKSDASDGAKEDKAILAPDYLQAKDRIDVEGDDDSSAGSSGWESSDGDSSAQTGSVESFDPNVESLGTSVSPSYDGTSAYSEEETEDRELLPESLNPAVNPVVQRGVTMIPVDEGDDEEDSASTSDDSDAPVSRGDVAPIQRDLDRAIEAGDWAAVGATAAILASDSERDDESATTRSAGLSTKSGSVYSSAASASTGTEYTDESGLDAARAAEIDQLVESGNWDGVVAVAARYADDASMTSSARKPSLTGDDDDDDDHSDASASVESARSIVTGATTKDSNRSSADGSRASTRLSDEGSSSKSPRGSASGATPPEDDMGTHASSITSSYVSRSGVSSSMVSNTSSMSNEKQQMNMYRAEVEALVRRVVPDEIDNIDDIMVQFSGREEELIETLKAMQEKSIAQRARAAVRRTAKQEGGRLVHGRSSPDGSDEDYSAQQTLSEASDPSSKASNYSSAYTSSGAGDSITEDFAGMSRGSSMYSEEGSSYYSRDDHSGTHSVDDDDDDDSDNLSYSGEGSGNSDERTMEDSYITTEHDDGGETNASSLSGAVDASDWRAMGTPAEMLGEKSAYSGPSKADRASGRYGDP